MLVINFIFLLEVLKYFKPNSLLFVFLLGIALYLIPAPKEFTQQSWTLFAIFIATIYGIVTTPVPMPIVALISICVCVLTNTLSIENALSGYSNHIVWLVMFAFFISRGFSNTNLGKRIAYALVEKIGKTTLGLSYGFVITDFILAPFMPSATARGGGTIFPIANSLVNELRSGSAIRQDYGFNTGRFLMMVCYQSLVVTSCMFLTSMAANPQVAAIASEYGITITWGSWALGSIIPGFIALATIPLVLYYMIPPDLKQIDNIQHIARSKLNEMGKVSKQEWIMIGTFITLLSLWIVGKFIGVSPVTTALIGCIILLLTRVISLDDILNEKGAWTIFFWFGALMMYSKYLVEFDIIKNIGSYIQYFLEDLSSSTTFVLAILIYFYFHYFLASATAKINVLYATFLLVLLNFDFPPMLSAMMLAYFSLLSSCLTHYALSPAPIFFGSGFFTIKNWWTVGFVMSLLYLLIFSTIGSAWWKLLGWW